MIPYTGKIIKSELLKNKDGSPKQYNGNFNFLLTVEIDGANWLLAANGKTQTYRYPNGCNVNFQADFSRSLWTDKQSGLGVFKAIKFDFVSDEEKAKFSGGNSQSSQPSTPQGSPTPQQNQGPTPSQAPTPSSNSPSTNVNDKVKNENIKKVIYFNDQKLAFDLTHSYLYFMESRHQGQGQIPPRVMDDLIIIKNKVIDFIYNDNFNPIKVDVVTLKRIKRYFVETINLIITEGIRNQDLSFKNSDDLIKFLESSFISSNYNPYIVKENSQNTNTQNGSYA